MLIQPSATFQQSSTFEGYNLHSSSTFSTIILIVHSSSTFSYIHLPFIFNLQHNNSYCAFNFNLHSSLVHISHTLFSITSFIIAIHATSLLFNISNSSMIRSAYIFATIIVASILQGSSISQLISNSYFHSILGLKLV